MDAVALAGWLVLLAATSTTIVFGWARRHSGAASALVVAGTLAFGSGLVTVGLAAAHLLGVLIVELGRSPLKYDFHVYALLLLGAMLAAMGARLAAAAAGVVRGEHTAWRRAVAAAVTLLAVNAPLAPIQGFAVALCIFVAIGLVALLAVRSRVA